MKRQFAEVSSLALRGTRGVCFVVMLTAFLAQGVSAKSGGGSGSTSVNVTSTVFDYDTYGALLPFRSDDYNGGNDATYTNVNGVESFIDSSGVLFLNLYRQNTGTRTVYITPNDAVGAQPAAPPAAYYWKNVEITSKCVDSKGNTVPFANLVNGSSTCTLGVDFNYNRVVYKLLVGRALNASDPTPGEASVTCNAVNGNNQCVAWTVTVGSSAVPVIANLYSYTGRPSAPWVFIGQYYNSARIGVTNP